MIEVTTYKSQSKFIRHKHLIYVDDPNIKSYSSYVLLKDYFHNLDVDVEKLDRFKRIKYSRNYLNTVLKTKKVLKCTYCGKMHLKIEEENMRVSHHIKATIDHVVPLSKGGDIFDTFNIVVSCSTCNAKKGNMPLFEFLDKFKNVLKPDMQILARFFK